MTLDVFRDYFRSHAQTWERLALTRARVLFGNGGFGKAVSEAIQDLLASPVDRPTLAGEVVAMRRKLEDSRARNDLKRGVGGLADIEFLVQYLQLAYASKLPEIVRPNLWDALDALRRTGLLDPTSYTELREAYNFFRTVEARLRIVHNRSGVDLPDDPNELARLARRLNYDESHLNASVQAFQADAVRHAARTRALFQEFVSASTGEAVTAVPVP